MMRVLIDAHMLGCRETGNETYILSLLRQRSTFAELGIDLQGAIRWDYSPELAWASRVAYLTCANDLHRLACDLPRLAQQAAANLLHVTYHAPFWGRLPYVVTIHDVSYRTRRRYHRPRNVLLQNVLGALSAWRARGVLTVSEFCHREILRIYPFLKGRLWVTPEAAEAHWAPRPASSVECARARFGIRGDYLLWVGSLASRKNPIRLVEAFLRATQESSAIQLVLAGNHATPLGETLQRKFSEAIRQQRLILTGYVDEETLASLYSGCSAFVFPSLYEGFGLPVLEAMQCGAPVITSNTTALPEVAGDAALLVDPEDADAIAAAIRRVIGEPALRAELRARGFARARQFSWAETARLTAQAYHAAVQARSR
ncbi:MAG: glycosyltransferase family 4 protein [Thermoflexales bacterium]